MLALLPLLSYNAFLFWSFCECMMKILSVFLLAFVLVGCNDEKQNTETVDYAMQFDKAIAAKNGKQAIEVAYNAGICPQGLQLLDTMEVYINTDDYVTNLESLQGYCDLMNP